MTEAAIALGSNLGDKRLNLQDAVNALEKNGVLTQLREGPVLESEPMYVEDQATFMNSVVAGECDLTPLELLESLKALESDLGREESFRNGPRLIDLDIVLFGDLVVSEQSLEIPHPRMCERPFVLQPLAAVLPDWRHPLIRKTASELLVACQSQSAGGDTLRIAAESIR